jgi:hypothetical protein
MLNGLYHLNLMPQGAPGGRIVGFLDPLAVVDFKVDSFEQGFFEMLSTEDFLQILPRLTL